MTSSSDLKLPKGVFINNPPELIQAILNMCRDAKVIGRAGSTNLPSVRCDVQGLTLGHWQKVWEALGPEVCKVIDAIQAQQGENYDNCGNGKTG